MGRLGITELLIILILLSIIILIVMSYWTLFERAGKPGWTCIVPFYNIIIQLEIIRKPWWWLFLMIIPYLGMIWGIWTLNLFVKSYGKNEAFTIGCIFLPFVFLPILAFDKSNKYIFSNSEIDEIGIKE